MKGAWLLLFVLLLTTITATPSGQPMVGECVKNTSCSCTYSDGKVVDLTPLANNDGTPFFLDVDDQTIGDQFSWNPCYPFTEESCSVVSVCQVRKNMAPVEYYSCGTQDSAQFVNDDQQRLTIQYTDDMVTRNDKNLLRTTAVVLTCDQSKDHDLIVTGERQGAPFYDMELQSKYACPRDPIDPPSYDVTVSISVGWILCIIFVACVVLYIVVGMVLQGAVRKKSGREMIPNYEFWASVPKLIKTGVIFTVKRGKVTNYDKI